jgi:hypothetical protein
MKTLWSLFKFLLGLTIIFALIGIFVTVSCVKQISRSSYVPDMVSEPELETTVVENASPPKVSVIPTVASPQNESIRWYPFNSDTKKIILSGQKCVFVYFADGNCCLTFERKVFSNKILIRKINNNYVAIKPPKASHKRFNIQTYPTIILLSKNKSVDPLMIEGRRTANELLEIMNFSFSSCN